MRDEHRGTRGLDGKKTWAAALLALIGLLSTMGDARAVTPYSAPDGDLTGDGSTDVVDIQCEVLVFTRLVLGQSCTTTAQCTASLGAGYVCRSGLTPSLVCLPDCLGTAVAVSKSTAPACTNPAGDTADCMGLVPRRLADLNCDAAIDSVDFNFLVQVITQKLGGIGTADVDSDGKLNFCDDDSDGDGDPDTSDCAALDSAASSKQSERCDGADNDCDAAVDETWPALGTACDDVDADQCANGVLACDFSGLGTLCQEVPAALWEICANNQDDDCDGEVDEDTEAEPCQAERPPVVGARVDFLTSLGLALAPEELGSGYYRSMVWSATTVGGTAAVQATCHGATSSQINVPVTVGQPAGIDLVTSRDSVVADAPTVRLFAFVADAAGRPASGVASVSVSVTGPFGNKAATLAPAGEGVFAGSYTPSPADFLIGGTETLVASAVGLQSGALTLQVTKKPAPGQLLLTAGQVGLTLPLGPRLAGQTVSVPVSAHAGGQTLASFQLAIHYPAALVEAAGFSVTNPGLNPAAVSDDPVTGIVTVAATRNPQTAASLLTGSIALGTLTLKIKAQAADGLSGTVSGDVAELLDVSGNSIASSAQVQVYSGQGQAVSGALQATVVKSRGLFAWLSDQSLVDLTSLGLGGETGAVHCLLADSASASPVACVPDQCICKAASICACAGSTVSVTGPGQTLVEVHEGAFSRSLPLAAHQVSAVTLTLADPTLQAVTGWPGRYQATGYKVVASLAGPDAEDVDVTAAVTLASTAPAVATWDQARRQVAGQAPGAALVQVLGSGGKVVAGASVSVVAQPTTPTGLQVVVPAMVEMTAAVPSPVTAASGRLVAQARVSSLFTAEGQQAPVRTFMSCADGGRFEISGEAGLAFAPSEEGLVVTVAGDVMTAIGAGTDTVAATFAPQATAIAAGEVTVIVALPAATGAVMAPTSAKIARSASDSAAVLRGLPTQVDLTVTVLYEDGTTADFTTDVRTHYEVVTGQTLVKVCNASDPDPKCVPGRVLTLSSGAGVATVRASWPGLYPGDVEAYATVEVVAHQGLTLSLLEDYTPPQVADTVLSLIEGTGTWQSARLRLVEGYSDGVTQEMASSPLASYKVTGPGGLPDSSVLKVESAKAVALAPGSVTVQGLLNGNASNLVPVMVEGAAVNDGDGKVHADIVNLALADPADLSGVCGQQTAMLQVTATFDDGTHRVLVSGGAASPAGLVEFLASNSGVCNPLDPLYATVNTATGVATLQGNGLTRVVARMVAAKDLAPLYQPGTPPDVTQANPLVLPTTHAGTRFLKGNCTPTTGDADLGASSGLPVPLKLEPGESVVVPIWVNSGTKALGAFSLSVTFDPTQFEVPAPSSQYLKVLIPADAAAINDPSPGVVKVTVVPAKGSSLVGTTKVAEMTLRAKSGKAGGPVFSKLGGSVLELYEACQTASCPAIVGSFGPAPRLLVAGAVSIDPQGNAAKKGDFTGDGKFGAADLQAILNYVTNPTAPQFQGLDKEAANVFPDFSAPGVPLIQAYDAYVGAMISVGLSHFVDADVQPAAGSGVTLSVTVLDGSSLPAPVTANLSVRFEVGLVGGASVAPWLACGAGCSLSKLATGAAVPERYLYQAQHQSGGIYTATIPDFGNLPVGSQLGVVVVLQNQAADGSAKGDPKVYLRTPFENVASPFDPLVVATRCSAAAGCAAQEACLGGVCAQLAGEGEDCALDAACADGLHCDETSGACVADLAVGQPCLASGDCTANAACVLGVCSDLLCELSGAQGQVVDCPLHLARGNAAFGAATMLEMSLAHDTALAAPVSLVSCGPLPVPFDGFPCPAGDECAAFGDPTVFCDPDLKECRTCKEWDVADVDAVLVGSGHAVETCAQPPPNCKPGLFKLLLWGAESLPISGAFFQQGMVQGESLVLTVRFKLAQAAAVPVPVAVSPVGFVATDAEAHLLALSVTHGGEPGHVVTTGAAQ